MKPIVSVVVPVYNTGRFLERCIKSILDQKFKEIELILVDDGSNDGAEKICGDYQAKYNYIKVIHKENAGLGYARNTGIDEAEGEYVAFVDSDDYLGCDFLYNLYEAIDINKADCAVAGFTAIYSNNRVQFVPCVRKEKLFQEDMIKELLLGSFGALPDNKQDVPYGQSVWARMFRRKLLTENNIRFVSEREYISEDIIFNIDVLRYAKCAVVIQDTSYHYNCVGHESLSKRHRSDRFKMDIILMKAMEKRLSDIFPDKQYMLYLQRFIIMRAGFDIIQEVLYHDKVDKTYPFKKCIKQMLKEDEFRDILRRYPWWKLPFLRMVLVGTMRLQAVDVLICFIRIQQWIMNDCK